MAKYVALLRGINVGGRNPVKMPALKEAFEANGLEDVSTYIQSGNVIFRSRDGRAPELTRRIEEMLVSTFGLPIGVVLRSRTQMRAIVLRAPEGFGSDPARFRYDVIFLKEPLTARAAIRVVPVKPGVDEAHAGAGVLYFSRLTAKASQSRMSRIVGLPEYRYVTIRNWNTTTALLRMLER